MEDLQIQNFEIVKVDKKWIALYESSWDRFAKVKSVLSWGYTKEEALQNSLNILIKKCNKIDKVISDMEMCVKRFYTYKTKESRHYDNEKEPCVVTRHISEYIGEENKIPFMEEVSPEYRFCHEEKKWLPTCKLDNSKLRWVTDQQYCHENNTWKKV